MLSAKCPPLCSGLDVLIFFSNRVSHLEVPYPVAVVDLASPEADPSDNVSPCGIPLHIRRLEVLRLGHGRHICRVNELQLSLHAATREQGSNSQSS